ncbi:unnamed protein product, partial [Ectocarpus sp. 13 AM-2016]
AGFSPGQVRGGIIMPACRSSSTTYLAPLQTRDEACDAGLLLLRTTDQLCSVTEWKETQNYTRSWDGRHETIALSTTTTNAHLSCVRIHQRARGLPVQPSRRRRPTP